jgi:hypothetical protein
MISPLCVEADSPGSAELCIIRLSAQYQNHGPSDGLVRAGRQERREIDRKGRREVI